MNESPIELSVLHKLRYTPLTDLVRGRLSARLDWAGFIRSSALPVDSKKLVLELARRMRL